MSELLHVVCPYCSATNRLPSNRLRQGPKCGQCHTLLFNGHPLELNSSNFEKQVSRNDIPLLVDFWAEWCGPCKMMAPAFEQAAKLLEPDVRLGKLNTEAESALSARYNIRSIPTLIVFKNGRELTRQSGAMNAGDIVRWVKGSMHF
ncbi:MAG: thioredoxin TrxC [Methylicorpusculum sp.]|uniref:thioredoxin TrxC n=2 Tax=Methylicorpusculum sp. TaxID=2713644 RepID=UPI00271565C3|nr:thioredoxin TrxC [Methylicorpusculum sp.]MDO8845639.1 thioredoxin TrxC [Methylicorpusculum sp.]MDO8938608.1 thioredoxin TrxC [Methylicorpusculum sp.]MDO9239412.1 thioredoxin TrxC [Methylicorpusculum sp.]MDP2179131.1 thioredoxin TrxC [Methylicorpusculum sp.]MDP2203633.1 thioredoxin TrxC [Methylicorpusculum sp.]